MKNNKLNGALVVVALLAGMGAGVAGLVSAQTTTTATASATPGMAAPGTMQHGHAPIGGDGSVTSINGTTLVMSEEADEGGAAYTVDAVNATVTKRGASGTFADIKVGDKIFVTGTTSGLNVAATSISVGHPGGRGHRGDHADMPAGN